MKLYFENSNGERRIIAECKTENEVYNAINAFILTCNRNKPKDKQFKTHYIRSWTDTDENKKLRTWYDVGSWSEFFFTVEED